MGKAWLKKYFQQVKRKLVGSRKERAEFIGGFTTDVTGYIELHPNCTSEDILLQFGKPEDISKEFNSMLDEDVLQKQIHRKRWFRVFLAAVLIVLVILVGFYIQDMHYFYHGHYEDTVTDGYNINHFDALDFY